ncbi:hypothetical protein H4I96_08765 [Botrytis cinerea]
MHLSSTYALSILAFLPAFTYAQAGLGGVVATSAATQMATTTVGAPSLYTVDLCNNSIGNLGDRATPLVGSVGLGTIQGTVGAVKNKRALPTAMFGKSH